jgi:hypothetical protein
MADVKFSFLLDQNFSKPRLAADLGLLQKQRIT